MEKESFREFIKKITFKKTICTIGVTWLLFCLACLVFVVFAYSYEALTQKEFWKGKSKGDCRIVNTKTAYNNSYKLITDKLIKNVDGKYRSSYHTYALDDNFKVYDYSNDKTVILDYNEFQNKYDFNDTIFAAKFENGVLTNIVIYDFFNINAYFSYLNTYVHYYTYKLFSI